MSVLIQPAAVRNVVEIRRGATPFCTRRLLICRHIDFSSPSRGTAAVAALGKAMQQRTARSSERVGMLPHRPAFSGPPSFLSPLDVRPIEG